MNKSLWLCLAVLGCCTAGFAQGSHRYWRLYVAPVGTADGTYLACAELEFHATVGGSDIPGGTPIVSGSYNSSTNPPSNCFDGNPSTWWASQSSGLPAWVGKDYGSPVGPVVEVKWTSRNDTSSQNPNSLVIQYSDDNSTWSTTWNEYSITGWSNGLAKTLTESQGPGVEVSKANVYAGSRPPELSVSKANAYSASGPPGLPVSKANAYSANRPPGLAVCKVLLEVVTIPRSTRVRVRAFVF